MQKPSNDSPRGYLRRFPSGGLWSADPADGQPPPWGLTDAQLALIRAGERITLDDGSTVEWKP
ncbi:MAG: hypothetical protein ABIL09_28455 [Gemmatimonadota bacterium]